MLTFPANVRLFLANNAVDGRKSFDGLSAVVTGQFHLEPMDGDLFIFLNKRGTQVRMLFWDRDGLCVFAKRLEVGTFRRVRQAEGDAMHVEIDAVDLSMLLDGVEAKTVRRRKRFQRKICEPNATKSFANRYLDDSASLTSWPTQQPTPPPRVTT
jgi:transposase